MASYSNKSKSRSSFHFDTIKICVLIIVGKKGKFSCKIPNQLSDAILAKENFFGGKYE